MSILMYFKRTNNNIRVNIKNINEKNNVGYPVWGDIFIRWYKSPFLLICDVIGHAILMFTKKLHDNSIIASIFK